MASIDLRHAYYSVPIQKEYRKYLRFKWKANIYQYTCLPNGIAMAPRQFTILMKPIYAKLCQMGHTNSGYIDDSILLGDTISECQDNIDDKIFLMNNVGFMIPNKKSVLVPVQNIVILGNHIDSVLMIVYLTQDRKDTILAECRSLYMKNMRLSELLQE